MESETEQGHDKQPQDKAVNMDGKEKLGDFCLVCFSKVNRSKLPKQSSLLSNNLNVIFLLRNLLQVPSELLIGNFKNCGSPAYWINLCENCSQLSSQAMEHHLQILTLVNQLRSVLKIITEKMKESSVASQTLTSYQDTFDKTLSMQEKRLAILKRTREFVTNYDYNTHLVNPFDEGDKLAGELDENDDESSLSDDSGEEEETAVESGDEDEAGGGGGWRGDWQDDDEGTDECFADEGNVSMERYVKVDGKFKCRYCETILSSKRSVREHEKRIHPLIVVQGQMECDICGKKVYNKLYLISHRRKVHKIDGAGNRIQCRRAVKRHVEVNGKWKCRHCEKLFLSKNSVCVHEKEKHASVPGQFKCEICGKRWNSKAYLSNHHKSAHKVDSEGNLIVIETRARHVEIDGKWKCRYCDKEFTSYRTVWSHEKIKHPSVPGQFVCDICGKAWNSKIYLQTHRRTVHKINSAGKSVTVKPRIRKKGKPNVKPKDPPTCHLCGKSFTWKFGLTKHLKHFHDKQFDVHCQLCGLGVYSEYSLKKHLLTRHKDDPGTIKLIEEGARLWKCGVEGCRGTYTKESGLEEHKRKVHGGGGGNSNKRFTCSFCGKTFWYWSKLKVHETLHKLGAERPYSCDICGAKFKAMGYVKRHKKRFHSGNNKG